MARGTPVDLGALVAIAPQVVEMLGRNDGLLRIVGSKDLLDGILNNSLHYMRNTSGQMTAVLNEHGTIVGHVQLVPAGSAGVLEPALVVFQIAAAVTLQYYLQRFDEQLNEISNSVRKSREDAAWAQITRAALETGQIAEALQRDGRLAPDIRSRLDVEERAADVVVLQEMLPVEESVTSLQAVRDECDALLLAHSRESSFPRVASALLETLPGGLRQRLRKALDQLEAALPHWYLAACAAQVHATLRTLRAVDDRLADRAPSAEGRDALLDRADSQAALGSRVGALLELPRGALELFTLDGAVTSRIARLAGVVASLVPQNNRAITSLWDAADPQIDEILLAMRKGHVVALAA